jgi:hypothetical protein
MGIGLGILRFWAGFELCGMGEGLEYGYGVWVDGIVRLDLVGGGIREMEKYVIIFCLARDGFDGCGN